MANSLSIFRRFMILFYIITPNFFNVHSLHSTFSFSPDVISGEEKSVPFIPEMVLMLVSWLALKLNCFVG